jgi:hypothetical protein
MVFSNVTGDGFVNGIWTNWADVTLLFQNGTETLDN